jgi:hypothetical protein
MVGRPDSPRPASLFSIVSYTLSVPYVMMRQLMALPCQSGTHPPTHAPPALRSAFRYDRWYASMQPFTLSSRFGSFLNYSSGYPDSVWIGNALGDPCMPVVSGLLSPLPVFGPSGCPDSLAAHLPRLLAAQQPSAYQRSRPSALILFWAG